jgi:polysaccharide export outer membrane protein
MWSISRSISLAGIDAPLRVNSRGMVSLPLLGPIKAAGKTVSELEDEITGLLADDFLQDPQVTVFVSAYTSQKITIEGAVKTPGIYPLNGNTSLLQAIVVAGGVSELANPRGIIIFRVIDGKRMAAVFDLREIRGGNAEDPRVYGDDLIVVDESGSKVGLAVVAQSNARRWACSQFSDARARGRSIPGASNAGCSTR